MPNPWSGPPGARPQGSMFHEIVVLPTLAPHLANPITTQAHREASVEVIEDTDDQPEGAEQQEEPVVDVIPDRLFFIIVLLNWVEKVPTTGRSLKNVKHQASKNVPTQMAVLKLTRTEFISTALAAHSYGDRYAAGPVSGPAVRVFWTGYPGGKASAPSISTDDDWVVLQRQLEATRLSVNTISVVFDLDAMEGFKIRAGPLVGPDQGLERLELTYGTRVPSAENFSPETHAIAQAIDKIKAHWECARHDGWCYLDHDAHHIALNRFRLKQWGAALLAEPRAPTEPPPEPLLLEWRGTATGTVGDHAAAGSKPRGRTGPNSQASAAPSTDTNALLIGLATPLMTMAMQQMANWSPASPPRASSSRVRLRSPSTPRHRDHPSSPPPTIEDELKICLEAFGRAKQLSSDIIMRAFNGLEEEAFSPDTLDQPTVARLQELTGLPEGRVYQLRRFAAQWSGKIDAKRARRA